MGCIYSGSEGCSLQYIEDEDPVECAYEDDPDPSDSCENYESDYYCSECGQDWNVEECDCNE